jgi:hypothetical protein
MDTIVAPAYSTASLVLLGLLVSTLFLAGIISLLYWINTRIRRGMKATRDDWRVEQDIESGHTLHAEGIYGTRHPEEGGKHLKQENPHPAIAGLKTTFKPIHASGLPKSAEDEPYDKEENRNVF